MKMNSRDNLLQVEEADIEEGELKINKEGCDLKQKDEGKSEYCMRRMISKDNSLLVEETDLGCREVVDEFLRIISFKVEERKSG